MSGYPGCGASRLLRAVNAHQAHGRVGSIVLPSAVAGHAGLQLGTERYEEAVWALCWWRGRLWWTGASRRGRRRGCRSGAPYRLAPVALRLLDVA